MRKIHKKQQENKKALLMKPIVVGFNGLIWFLLLILNFQALFKVGI